MWVHQDGLIPDFMRMDQFEAQAVHLGERALIDPLQRVLLLREAADFADFAVFKVDHALVKFFARSEGLFRFFEELAREEVDFDRLAKADAYAEFGEHLAVLSHMRERYGALLERRGLCDTMFVPQVARLNEGFLSQFERIEIFLEGLLSRYELRLLDEIAAQTDVILHFTPTPFSTKMAERFARRGIILPAEAASEIDLSRREVTPLPRGSDLNEKHPLKHRQKPSVASTRIMATSERYEQISTAFAQIQQMVESGIAPERIALILPDEGFKEAFRLYDKLNNLNFAMGFDYTSGRTYKTLTAIAAHWHMPDAMTTERLERYGLDEEQLQSVAKLGKVTSEVFWSQIDRLELRESDPLRIALVSEARIEFSQLFPDEQLTMTEWLHLWLQRLSAIRIDDLRGGMVTVMGVLETRGVSFDGVVIVDFNEGIVPATTSKDQFLNSQVRAFADLPTRSDRESLQKHYYHRLLSQARDAVILYTASDNRLPSKFLYELGLESVAPKPVQQSLLYDQPSRLVIETDPVVESFDATAQTWSASRLSTWIGCRRRYYYRYIRGIGSKPDTELNEGAFLHTLLDQLYRTADHYDTPEAFRDKLHRLMDVLLPEDTPRIAYQKILWKRKLEPFIAQQIAHFQSGWRVVEREKEFTGSIVGLRFKGRIDRIDQDATHTLVIDYKSGSLAEANRSRNLEEATDFQMNIYRHLLENKYTHVEPVFWSLFDKGEMVPANALDEKEEYLGEHIHQLRDAHSFVAEKTDKLSRCTYCEFALLCGRGEFKGASNNG
jgi:RecB family exonuclease